VTAALGLAALGLAEFAAIMFLLEPSSALLSLGAGTSLVFQRTQWSTP